MAFSWEMKAENDQLCDTCSKEPWFHLKYSTLSKNYRSLEDYIFTYHISFHVF